MLDFGWWHHRLMRCKQASGNNRPSSRFKGAWVLFMCQVSRQRLWWYRRLVVVVLELSHAIMWFVWYDGFSMMGFAVVPYIHGVTEPIRRILCGYNVKVAQKRFLTLNHIFAKPKDPVPKEQKSDAIYSILCNECNQEYIGQTKRQFGHV